MAKVSAQRTLAALFPTLLLTLLPATIAHAQSDPHTGASANQTASDLSGAMPLDVQARMRMGKGDSRGALELMRAHLAAHPDDRAARLDLVRYLTWNGNYAKAERVLLADPDAERSPDGQQLHAGLLAWAGRIDSAQTLNAPLLAANPDDFLANYTQAIALRQSAKPRDALPYVEAVQRIKPGSTDANGLERGTWVLANSFISLDYDHASDSTDLTNGRPTLRAELAQGDALHYTIELGHWDNRSPLSSPFAAVNGNGSVSQNRGLFGVRYASSLATQWSAAIGYSSIDNIGNQNDGTMLWRAGVDHRADDDWRLGLQLDHDRFAVSPRSLSLGLTRTGAVGQVHWTPNMLWTGDFLLRDDHYSDSNNSVEWDAALRRAVVRRPGVMLDLGAQLQHISYDENPGNGYYAPSDYRRYALTASAYFGLSEEVGLSLQGALGRQRDETFTAWRRADDISAAMVFGISTPWQLILRAGYSERVQNTGAYAGRNWGMTLTRRF